MFFVYKAHLHANCTAPVHSSICLVALMRQLYRLHFYEMAVAVFVLDSRFRFSVVFAGFSANSLAERLEDAHSRVVRYS